MLSFDPLHSDFAEMNGMNPFKSIAVPRPICWVSTVSEDGIDNLAPYSQFSNVGFNPPYVMFCGHPKSDGSRKDSVVNAENTGCFVHNFVPYSLRDAMNITSKPSGREVDPQLPQARAQEGIRDDPRLTEPRRLRPAERA